LAVAVEFALVLALDADDAGALADDAVAPCVSTRASPGAPAGVTQRFDEHPVRESANPSAQTAWA
jgi:hypothetical protein